MIRYKCFVVITGENALESTLLAIKDAIGGAVDRPKKYHGSILGSGDWRWTSRVIQNEGTFPVSECEQLMRELSAAVRNVNCEFRRFLQIQIYVDFTEHFGGIFFTDTLIRQIAESSAELDIAIAHER